MAQARGMLALLQHPIDVAIIDLGLPDGYGGDLIEGLREAHPKAQTLVLSASLDRANIARAVQLGASGVLSKTAHLEVVQAVRRLRAGETLMPLEEVVELLRFSITRREEEHEAHLATEKLTPSCRRSFSPCDTASWRSLSNPELRRTPSRRSSQNSTLRRSVNRAKRRAAPWEMTRPSWCWWAKFTEDWELRHPRIANGGRTPYTAGRGGPGRRRTRPGQSPRDPPPAWSRTWVRRRRSPGPPGRGHSTILGNLYAKDCSASGFVLSC
jgi:CheY-like chemotaxis protein